MSKLSDYLQQQNIDPRRLLVASHDIEANRPEDRATRLAKKRFKTGEEKVKEAAKEAAAKKPRSGKPLSRPLLDRALNVVLGAKKKGEVTLRELF
jgi:hypothetical protein